VRTISPLFVAASAVALLWCSPTRAYEGGTTHAGLTSEAALKSKLHTFLRRDLGLPVGLFSRLEIIPGEMSPRAHKHLKIKLSRMDPSGGYTPDQEGSQFAIGWAMAGSVLADMPASLNRHHFYNPSSGKGLDNKRALASWWASLMATLEGGDTVRELLTGTGFDLTGRDPLDWMRDKYNPLSVEVFYGQMIEAARQKLPAARDHALARSLMALGGLLHLLQDMASPTHVRNDFYRGHLQRLGRSTFNRGSAYERYVAATFGQRGIPAYEGPAIVRHRLRDFFTSPRWDGLADRTSIEHFSPGTIPAQVRIFSNTDPAELRQRLSSKMPLEKPALGSLDLACAMKQTCYQKGPAGPRLAYRVDHKRRLRFFLDRQCHAAAASKLLPLAIGFSSGLIDYLLRGEAALSCSGDGFTLKNTGPAVSRAKVHILVEDAQQQRKELKVMEVTRPAPTGQLLAAFSAEIPDDARAVVVLLDGLDQNGERLIAVARHQLSSAGTLPGLNNARLKGLFHRPASLPASQPADASTP